MDKILYGCVLIGGKSSRMGTPKQLIVHNGHTWLEIICQQLSKVCQEVLVVGSGELPPGKWSRKNDVSSCRGPLAGILAAMETNPHADFIVCSCDIPYINEEAIEWLVLQNDPDFWAVLPSLEKNYVEPLFAYYGHKMFSVLQQLTADDNYKLSTLSHHSKTKVVFPPLHLHNAWKNCNTIDDLPTA